MSTSNRPSGSLEPEYFERIYADEVDPWGFATREYERAKYADTIASIPRKNAVLPSSTKPYQRGLEIGCSIGVLSRHLADYCESLLSLDVNSKALAEARRRNLDSIAVEFREMMFPREVPEGPFDLIVVSEVAYYWGGSEFTLAQNLLLDLFAPGGHLVLVHYTPEETDYPLTGDEVHERFLELTVGEAAKLLHVEGHRAEGYRVDVFEGM